MENKEKQLFIKEFERDLKLKISELKKEQQVFNTLSGLKMLMRDEGQKDAVFVIIDKLQMFVEKQLSEEIEIYEVALLELQKIKTNEKDIETNGMVA